MLAVAGTRNVFNPQEKWNLPEHSPTTSAMNGTGIQNQISPGREESNTPVFPKQKTRKQQKEFLRFPTERISPNDHFFSKKQKPPCYFRHPKSPK
jgi:hypothetical protein